MVERLDGIKFRCMDPEMVAKRWEWIAAGKPGHYPGCQCERCHTKQPTGSNDLLNAE